MQNKRDLDISDQRLKRSYHSLRRFLVYQQAEDIETTENIDVHCIEPQYEYQGLVSTIHPPDYWRNLGSSKSRTKQEEEAGKECILDLLNNQPFSSAVAFTDGSCSGSPGPCGSSAIIFHKEEEIELKRAVSSIGSILLAEIIAIKIVLHQLQAPGTTQHHHLFGLSISSWYSYFKLEK
jgi:hypothetical protein